MTINSRACSESRRWPAGAGVPFILGALVHALTAGAADEPPRPTEVITIGADGGWVIFSPDGKQLAGKVSGRIWRPTDVKVWDAASGEERIVLQGHTGGIWRMDYSPDSQQLVTNDNYTVKVWDLADKREVLSFRTPVFTRCALFIADGTRLATGHDDGRIRLWDAETAELLSTLRGHTEWVPALSISRDGKKLASASLDLSAKIWDLSTGRVVSSLEGHDWYLSSVAFGPHGRRLVTGSDDGTAKVWDLVSGQPLANLTGHRDWVRDVAFSPNGRWVATASTDHTAKLWNAATGNAVATMEAHTDVVSCVSFSPDGLRLATASHDKTIKLWDVPALVPAGVKD